MPRSRVDDVDANGVAPLRVWIDPSVEVDPTERSQRLGLAPVARAHLDRRHAPEVRSQRYGSLLTRYRIVDDLPDAEVALLPHLVEDAPPDLLRSTLLRAEAAGLRTLVFSGHDLEPLMPAASVILLHPGPTRGAQPEADVLAVPYFPPDRAGGVVGRRDGTRPSVAFCGQGAHRLGAGWVQAVGRGRRWAANRLRPNLAAPPVRSHVALRSETLARLRDDLRVDDRFAIRDRYRAGASDEHERARTQAEFDDNLRSATYALCVRGTGNFSARFYEALSFGRVPLFVDTDCVLPLEHEIDWRRHTVWVDRSEVRSVAERLVAAHRDVVGDPDRSPEALRRLWEERLTSDGFFRHLVPVVRRML